jgi:hypothetical protein
MVHVHAFQLSKPLYATTKNQQKMSYVNKFCWIIPICPDMADPIVVEDDKTSYKLLL